MDIESAELTIKGEMLSAMADTSYEHSLTPEQGRILSNKIYESITEPGVAWAFKMIAEAL